MPLNLDTYFAQDVDERQVQTHFNFELIREQLPSVIIFTDEEREHLLELQQVFRQHLDEMSQNEYNKEMERLGIDLSWKYSQIEGNTYSLLETERLLRESKTADGKTKDERDSSTSHRNYQFLGYSTIYKNKPQQITEGAIKQIKAGILYNLACCYALTEQKKDALSELGKSVENGFNDYNNMANDSDLISIYNDKTFKKC